MLSILNLMFSLLWQALNLNARTKSLILYYRVLIKYVKVKMIKMLIFDSIITQVVFLIFVKLCRIIKDY